jgi:hypothetical protein
MSDTHEVISAFLDDEPFDASRLAEALSESGGRDLLIDLVALHHLTQMESREAAALAVQKPRRSALRALAAVAAVLVVFVGGYVVGERRTELVSSAPPAATRIVEAPAAWQELPSGRMQ